MKLICFPHAGGLASYYNFLRNMKDVNVILYEYSGRAGKLNEADYTNFQDAVGRISKEVNQIAAAEDYAIFGHSMGAYIAYEVALMMQNKYMKPAKWLFVSGQASPIRYKKVDIIEDNVKFLSYISRLGGIDKEIINNTELSNLFLPVIRRDFEMYNTYKPTQEGCILDTKVYALYGKDDLAFDTEYIDEWKAVAKNYLGSKQFKGDHFYFKENKDEIVNYLETIIL